MRIYLLGIVCGEFVMDYYISENNTCNIINYKRDSLACATLLVDTLCPPLGAYVHID